MTNIHVTRTLFARPAQLSIAELLPITRIVGTVFLAYCKTGFRAILTTMSLSGVRGTYKEAAY